LGGFMVSAQEERFSFWISISLGGLNELSFFLCFHCFCCSSLCRAAAALDSCCQPHSYWIADILLNYSEWIIAWTHAPLYIVGIDDLLQYHYCPECFESCF
jgi:hypothetical protein